MQGKKLLNPEYGGDGVKVGKGGELEKPLVGFPGALGAQRSAVLRRRSVSRALPARRVHRVPRIDDPHAVLAGRLLRGVRAFRGGAPSGPWEVFADGFSGVDPIVNTSDAAARPVGLAQGPDGSLYVSDSVKGKIWRVMFKGDRASFGAAQLARMEARKQQQAHIRQPDEQKDVLGREVVEAGAKVYEKFCVVCHQRDGKGDGSRFPSLVSTNWVLGQQVAAHLARLERTSGRDRGRGQEVQRRHAAARLPERRADGAAPDVSQAEFRQSCEHGQCSGGRGGSRKARCAGHATCAVAVGHSEHAGRTSTRRHESTKARKHEGTIPDTGAVYADPFGRHL